MTSQTSLRGDLWSKARTIIANYVDGFSEADRYEKLSALLDAAARDIADLLPTVGAGAPVADDVVERMADAASAHLAKLLSQRVDWLTREWQNGGDFEHLHTRERECAYIIARYVSGPSMQDAMRAALQAAALPVEEEKEEAEPAGDSTSPSFLGLGGQAAKVDASKGRPS